MRWIAVAVALMPLPALACLEKPTSSCSGVNLTTVLGVVAASCALGWVVHRVLGTSGQHTPEVAVMIATIAGLFGGPLLWFIFTRL
jgi:high-affinity Fe2+/Pb2+ permease